MTIAERLALPVGQAIRCHGRESGEVMLGSVRGQDDGYPVVRCADGWERIASPLGYDADIVADEIHRVEPADEPHILD